MYAFVASGLPLSPWIILPWFGFILSLTTDLFHCHSTITLIKPLSVVPGSVMLSETQWFKNSWGGAVWFQLSAVALVSVLGVVFLWITRLVCIRIRRWADLRFPILTCPYENSAELKPYGNFSTKIIKGISKASLEFPCETKERVNFNRCVLVIHLSLFLKMFSVWLRNVLNKYLPL